MAGSVERAVANDYDWGDYLKGILLFMDIMIPDANSPI